jgi:YVTN family beta-propeller protein
MPGLACLRGLYGRGFRFALVLASAMIALSASADSAVAGVTAYVVNVASGTVIPLVTETGTPGTPIPVGLAPEGIAVTPDGKTVYVTSQNGTVTPIATATNTPGTPISIAGLERGWIAISPDGQTAYVTSEDHDTVTPITVATNTPLSPISVGSAPLGIAITPDGKTAYVANQGSASVTPISLETNTPGSPITVGENPTAIAIAPDGLTAYVVESGNTVTPIAVATDTAGPPISLTGASCYSGSGAGSGIAITPDGATAYIANPCSGIVTPITLATNTPGAPILAGADGIAITPDGSTVYVTNFVGTVTPIAVATDTPGDPITFAEVGLVAIAITPARPTVTSLRCSPSSVVVTQRTTCTAMVRDTGSGSPVTPTGTVGFETDSSGTFARSPCTLRGIAGVASCQVTYTSSTIGGGGAGEQELAHRPVLAREALKRPGCRDCHGRHTITAIYAGDSAHGGSTGQTSVVVRARASRTMVACVPTTLAVGQPGRCTATVADTARGQLITPTGTVKFASSPSPNRDIFTGSPCILSGSGVIASCTVDYIQTSVGTGRRSILAYYRGDQVHHASRGQTTIRVRH